MKRLSIVLVLVVGGTAVLGFSRGWFHLASTNAEDQSNVTVTVDKGKIQQDKQSVEGKVGGVGQTAKDKAAATIPKK